MSKTVSGQDVEDMLSSVRRLVSSELPPHQRRTSRQPEPEKLVLTDAQRIEPPKKTARVRSQRLEDRIAELEAAVSKTPDDWEPDGSEDQAQHRPDRIVYSRPPESQPRTPRRTSRITLLEAASDGTMEPPKGAPEEPISTPVMTSADVEAMTREAVVDEVSKTTTFDDALKEAVDKSLAPATEREAPLESRQSEPPKDAANDSGVQQAVVTPPPASPEPKAPEVVQPVEVERAETVQDASAAFSASEETLRPIVRQLLREELQGEMGERITRNVRKLVRQEIQRALAAEGLD